MNNSSTFAGFLKTHVRLLVVAIALFSLLATAMGSFILQQRTGAHAATGPTGAVVLHASSNIAQLIDSYLYKNLTQSAAVRICMNAGLGYETPIGHANSGDEVLVIADSQPNCTGNYVASFAEKINGSISCFAEFGPHNWYCY